VGLFFHFQLLSKLEIYILLASVHFGLVMDGRKRPARQSAPASAAFLPNPNLKLLDQCREVLRFRHYSYRTEQTYVEWIQRYVRFCRNPAETSGPAATGWRHPRDCGPAELKAFLSHLALDRRVGASTQNQALNALVFLYRQVLGADLGDFSDFARARRPVRLPAVLTREECDREVKGSVPGQSRIFAYFYLTTTLARRTVATSDRFRLQRMAL